MNEDLKLPEDWKQAARDGMRSPEDRDNNGLTERPSVRWLVWCSDAFTEFCNGCLAALLSGVTGGVIVGGGTAAQVTSDPTTIRLNALVGFVAPVVINGGVALKEWHRTNRMPNPFKP